MRSLLFPAFLVALTTLLPHPGSGQDSPAPPAPAPESSSAGMVWRVSGGKSPMFLAGSFHLLRQADYPLPESYERAWKESQQVVFEILPGEMEQPAVRKKVISLSLLSEGKLSDHLSPETWKNLSDWAAETGNPLPALQRMRPWMAGMTVALSAYEKLGYQSSLGMEKHFGARLKESGKTALALETAEGQIGLFSRIDAKQQENLVRQALTEINDPEKIRELAQAWRTGDATALHERMHRSFAGFPELEKLLLTDRNAEWIPKLEKLLQSDQATMVLVGTGHLCGPGGVVDLLEKKGYRPVLLQPAAPPAVKKAA